MGELQETKIRSVAARLNASLNSGLEIKSSSSSAKYVMICNVCAVLMCSICQPKNPADTQLHTHAIHPPVAIGQRT